MAGCKDCKWIGQVVVMNIVRHILINSWTETMDLKS
jgi:hypothetical protein